MRQFFHGCIQTATDVQQQENNLDQSNCYSVYKHSPYHSPVSSCKTPYLYKIQALHAVLHFFNEFYFISRLQFCQFDCKMGFLFLCRCHVLLRRLQIQLNHYRKMPLHATFSTKKTQNMILNSKNGVLFQQMVSKNI